MKRLDEIQIPELSNDLKVEISIYDISQIKIQIHSSILKQNEDLLFKEINIVLSPEKTTIQQSSHQKGTF
jgi:citrate lyase gamma subunit